MGQSRGNAGVPHGIVKISKFERYSHLVLTTLRKNIAWTMMGVLTSCWLAIAYFVFQFEHKAQGANITSYEEGVWWGIVTFLTVGYGDRYPITPGGRVLGGLLMLFGVVAVGILTAKISTYFLEQALREGRGIVDTDRLKNHFVICGWKEEMHEVLLNILAFNPDLDSNDIVIIANLSASMIDELRAHPRLKKIHVVAGDYFSEINLRRAAPERARKVMILADRTPMPNGQQATATEVDAKTVMTAMTLSHIARGTLIAAEVLDPKMDQYLKLAMVSEVIYSREYNRLLLANVSGGTGVSNIIFDLLDPKTNAFLTTKEIPNGFVGKTYGELKAEFATKKDFVILGILENSGNQHHIKELALRRAQKTADVNQLLSNLRTVKGLRCNQPVFNPREDYLVNEGSLAIVIEVRAMKEGKGHGPDAEETRSQSIAA